VSSTERFNDHAKWVPCHHCMARPQVVDGGDGLQIWMVAANILHKQSRIADREWFFSLGVGRGLTTPPHKKSACYEILHGTSEMDGFFGTAYAT
jgi:hypothetical protein